MKRQLAAQFAILIGGCGILGVGLWLFGVPPEIGGMLGVLAGFGLAAFAMWAVPLE